MGLALVALLVGAQPAYLQAKAALAQVLLRQAWADNLQDGGSAKPWPWADTHPVARIAVPRLGIEQIVLAGDSGRVLAFGPGWAEASAQLGTHGHSVISGHRDNHFAFLRKLDDGDRVLLQTASGIRVYRITGREVVDSRRTQLRLDGADSLSLVTCWPFDAISAGGPLRYVVTAVPEDSMATSRNAPTGTDRPSGDAGSTSRTPRLALR